MVNSKKMRKSTVAIVLLSILLCLSMILTATGAWYTNSSKIDGSDGSIDFEMSDWMTISVGTASADGTFKVERNAKGEGTWADVTATEGVYKVLPGDRVTFTDGARGTFKVTSAVPFYYIISTDGGANWSSVAYHDAGTDIVLGEQAATTVTDDDNMFELNAGVYTVKTTTTYNASATGFSLSYASAGLQIKAIQSDNLTSTEAAEQLASVTIPA